MFDENKYNKFYSVAKELLKSDVSLTDALKIARQHNPQAGQVLARHIYTDSLIPKVGNSYAYKDFLTRHGNDGIHVSMDANSFGSINKEHGFETGNEAIKHLFNTASEVSRKFGGKAFRTGGDEGRLHFPTPERALGFAKELKEKLGQSEKIGGKHQLSVSLGIGYNPGQAEKSLIMAKDQLGSLSNGKRQKLAAPGSEPTVWHSVLHEPPPANWRPAAGKSDKEPHEDGQKEIDTNGLKFNNPVK